MEIIIKIIVFIAIFVGLFTTTYYLLGFIKKEPKRELPKKLPFCSILIPAYNEESCIEKTTLSALALNYPKNKFEIIIIDDGSKDKTLELSRKLEKKYSSVRVFTKPNGGKGSALNYGIKKSKGEIIISLDSDSVVDSNALMAMIPYFDNPKVMCVTPSMRVLNPKGILQRIQAFEYDMGIFLRKAFATLDAINVTPGPFSAYRKYFFEKHGGYNEKTITEDMEVAMRIQSLNYKIESSLNSIVYTIAPNKFIELAKQRRRWYTGLIENLSSYRYMFSKEYGELGLVAFPLLILSIFTVSITTIYYLTKGIYDGISQLLLYSNIGFDFVNNFRFQWSIVSLSFYQTITEPIFIFAILFLIVSFSTIYYFNRKTASKEKPLTMFLNYFIFSIFYGAIYTFWWIVSIYYALGRKKVEW
jgi:cellulose synthase/poly-beta-1,6-N-acetylglucosamine synthase-like glycosyltransferase